MRGERAQLNHPLASGGDIRRLCDLCGLTVGGAERYAHTTDQPDQDYPSSVYLTGRVPV